MEPLFFKTSRKWDEEEDWNRDRWRSRTWWETAEQDQHWSWQQDTWQQDGQDWDQRESWQYEASGQDSNDPTDPWQGWEGVAAWNKRQAEKSDSSRRPRSPAQEPASGSRQREDPPRKKGRAWWERPPPEYHPKLQQHHLKVLGHRSSSCCAAGGAGPTCPGRRRVGRKQLRQLEQQQLGARAGATALQPGSEPAGGAHMRRSPGVLGKRGKTQRALLTSEGPAPTTA